MKINRLYPILFAAFGLTASAADFTDVTAGRLSSVVTDSTETALKITGTINAADLSFIQDKLNALVTLDLSGASIEAYAGNSLPYTGLNVSAANTLPAYSLTGLKSLESITLPANLTEIGKGALSGTGITSINIPEGVETIGDYALMRCESLKSINIPKSVTSIGNRALAFCKSLESVVISPESKLESLPEGFLLGSGSLKTLDLSSLANMTEIGPWSLAECDGLETLTLPASTEVLAERSLYGDSGIKEFAMAASIDSIGSHAMGKMTGLTKIDAAKVTKVPALGEGVWTSVTQNDVTLIVPDALAESFEDADQWKEFRIQKKSESSTTTIGVGAEKGDIDVSYDGVAIHVTGHGSLGRTSVYNISGHQVASAVTTENKIEIPASGWTKGVYLVVSQQGVKKIAI